MTEDKEQKGEWAIPRVCCKHMDTQGINMPGGLIYPKDTCNLTGKTCHQDACKIKVSTTTQPDHHCEKCLITALNKGLLTKEQVADELKRLKDEDTAAVPVGHNVKSDNPYTDYIEVWKCEVCGVWEGCVHKGLKGEKPPKCCVRYCDAIPTWVKRSNQSIDDYSISATAPQQPSNEDELRQTITNLGMQKSDLESHYQQQIADQRADLGDTIKHLQDLLHRKNVQLDAMDWVWCSGGCEEGLHRYNDLPELTEEMVLTAERNTERLRRHWENVKFQKGGK